MTGLSRHLGLATLALALSSACSTDRGGSTSRLAQDVTTGRVVRDPGFANIGSVVHDGISDAYFATNINGGPFDEDANGFISIVDGDGRLMALKYIDAAAHGIPLHAPRGLAVVDTIVYVTDIHTVWRFHKETGEVLDSRRIPGATALHAIVAHPNLSVYFTDAGMRQGASGLEPSGSDAVYRFHFDGRLDTLAMGTELGRPTGIAVQDGEIWVLGGASGEIYRLEGGQRVDIQQITPGLEGLVGTDIGFFATEPGAGAIWRGRAGEPFSKAVEGLAGPQAIHFDRWRFHLLVVTDRGAEFRAVPLGF